MALRSIQFVRSVNLFTVRKEVCTVRKSKKVAVALRSVQFVLSVNQFTVRK